MVFWTICAVKITTKVGRKGRVHSNLATATEGAPGEGQIWIESGCTAGAIKKGRDRYQAVYKDSSQFLVPIFTATVFMTDISVSNHP